MTYDVATMGGMILGTVPSGGDLAAVVERTASEGGFDVPAYEVVRGLTLTDNLEPGEDWAFKSGSEGWLFDETGRDWRFAVRRS